MHPRVACWKLSGCFYGGDLASAAAIIENVDVELAPADVAPMAVDALHVYMHVYR